MNTMKWLVRREFWEHKGSLFWAPLIAALALVLIVGATAAYGISSSHLRDMTVTVNGDQVGKMEMLMALPHETKAKFANIAANTYIAAAVPVFMVLPIVAFFYCLGALYDDRRDRSILFWKSLPLSDSATVLSKVITALAVAPVITIGLGTAAALAMLTIGGIVLAHQGLNMFGAVLSDIDLYLAPLYLLGLLPVYILWALPTVGWLLLVSSWAKSKVLSWAVGIPSFAAIVIKWFSYLAGQYLGPINADWFIEHIIMRGLLGLIPGIWMSHNPMLEVVHAVPAREFVIGALFTQSWATLAQPGVWLGAIAGIAMLGAAIRLRRYRDEG